GKACFDSIPAVKPKDVEGLVVGSVMPERTAFQSHISSLAAEALGIKPSALSARTEHMCASGTVAIRYAYAFIAAGLADHRELLLGRPVRGHVALGRERETGRRREPEGRLPLADDRDALAPVHVLADHRRRRGGDPRERGAGARADRQAGLDPGDGPGARRLPAHLAPRRLLPLARARARGPGRVPDGRHRSARGGPRRGARLLRDG